MKYHFPSNKIQKDLAPAQMTSAVLYQSTQKWNSSKRLTFARNKQQILKNKLSSCLLACSCSTALTECNTSGLGNKQNYASCHPRRPVWRVQKAKKVHHFSSFSTFSASSQLTVTWLLEKEKNHMQVWRVRHGVGEQHIPAV